MSDQITIVGNIAAPPSLVDMPSGARALRFRLATNHRRYDRASQGWVDEDPNWFSVVAYRALAVNGAASLAKGMRVIVSGRLRIRHWESEKGTHGTDVEIVADALGADLLFGTTAYQRVSTGGERAVQAGAAAVATASETEPADAEPREEASAPDAWAVAPLGAVGSAPDGEEIPF